MCGHADKIYSKIQITATDMVKISRLQGRGAIKNLCMRRFGSLLCCNDLGDL